MDIGHTPRLGLVVPPENPTAEPEYTRLAGDRLNVHTSRLPVYPGLSLRETLDKWIEALPETISRFGALDLDALVIACNASHYLLSPEGDRRACAELTERAGFPVVSSPLTILAAFEALGIDRITLVSPYEPWLTDISRVYWEAAGIAVDAVALVRANPTTYDPYLVTTEQLLEQVDALPTNDARAVLFTGTGMHTLAALRTLDVGAGPVLLSTNLASLWWALHTIAPHQRTPAHPLLQALDDRRVATERPGQAESAA
ncbi:maleate cis-trans isomerase family protein [Nocardia bovistercoris]|uniref:Arylmalonate decarboxylase n=1 Tax=Nocardia bovistercoris TaxID=2785916 RepID=A0A931ID78_9NOCA|nr:arylmalonate decarboxylase [Nocardia bovistercoris]MBH0779289.1 hypothetical protein [Nocardia bovistercoris]